MQTTPKFFIAVIIAAVLTACSSGGTNSSNSNSANQSANSSNSNSIKDNVDGLELVVNMPFKAEEAFWMEENVGKPAAEVKKLTAVLRFSRENADKLVAQAEKYKPASVETVNTEKWFPAELIAQSQMSGDKTLKGAGYQANDFFNAPYTTGKITRIERTDYFVLELFSK